MPLKQYDFNFAVFASCLRGVGKGREQERKLCLQDVGKGREQERKLWRELFFLDGR